MTEGIDPALFQILAARTVDYGIFLLDTEGRVISWNAGARKIKGYEEAQILGRHFSVFYTAEDIARDWPQQELKRALQDGRFEDEGWRVKKDGSRFWASVVITALRDDSGKLLAYSKITRDISERKRQEEALRQSEERFRLLVDSVSDYAIYLLDPDGIVASWNLGARRIKGYEAAEIIGQHFSRFYDSASIEEGKPWMELAMARQHGRAEEEGWRLRKDGSRFWARVVVTALHNADGRLTGFAKVTQDLTQRRHAESLEEASQRINDFIAVLAHELRNPLAPIRNSVQVLRMIKPGDPLFESTRQVIDRQSSHLSRIVDDLLDVNRITRGTLDMKSVPTLLQDVVSRAVEAVRPAINEANHILDIHTPVEPVFVLGDELRLTQALSNIVGNASRYSENGGRISVRVYVAKSGDARSAFISVRDSGHGIDPSLLGSIFGMFVQGRNPLRKVGTGLGIGLALSRSIVELHHGTIEAKSEGPGKGSEFIIALPLLDAAQSREEIREDAPAPPSTFASAKKYRILVVDDNIDAASSLSILLRGHGHEVHSVHDGNSAISAFEGFRPDIVLLDIGMPGMNGLEVARRIRQRKRNPRPMIVAVTGWGQPDDEMQSMAAGFDHHLVKPVEEEKILDLIAQRTDTPPP